MKRIELTSQTAGWHEGVEIEVEDDAATELIKKGHKLAASQRVYNHQDEMSASVRDESLKALAAADAAGQHREQAARSAATASFRKAAK